MIWLIFQCLTDPSLSPCEVEMKRLLRLQSEPCLRPTVEPTGEATKLEEIILQHEKMFNCNTEDSNSGEPQVHEDWVHLAEQVPPLLIKALPHISNREGMITTCN